ncbi:MAG: glycosyltransferase family 2 protein [Patescibacteria group bacterium]|nr:glycosyltransferase family 2 protein [Patescibacteria group bacterium]
MAKVSINLVTWNGEKFIEACLNSILEQDFSDYFLLIIDNGSSDKTVSIIEQQFVPVFGEKIRFIKNKENLGFAKAHNQAILWTDSVYVLTLNQDVILGENYVSEAVKFLDEHDKVAAVTGKILRAKFEQADDLKNIKKSDIIDSTGLKIFKSQRAVEIGAGEKDEGQYEEQKEVFGVSATCPLYRREALNEVRFQDEFFDNDFFSYKEDVDLAYRLRWRGWKSFYLPEAVCFHERSAISQERISGLKLIRLRKHRAKFINYHSYKNHLFVLSKNLSLKDFFRYFFQITFYEFTKFFYIFVFEHQTVSGLKDFFSKRSMMKEKRKIIMRNCLVGAEEMRKWFE